MNTNPSNFDNLLLQTLMNRLQIRPQINPLQNPLFNQSLETLLLDTLNQDNDSDHDSENEELGFVSKTNLAKEESKLEKEVIKMILSGKSEEALKPNSGQAVSIGEHHICVGFHVEKGSEYRVWEWHGHIMLFDDENGYSPEYIYGNYFERMREGVGNGVKGGVVKDDEKEEEEEEEEKNGNSGLKELIGSSEEMNGLVVGRILHRNMNAGSSRV
ncbi:hypothetical protein CTI12_AA405510 [Artemisia annua]|uniref:Uncharacterized protein n=1 Tax=Artemisia annua TaxID=35608 RepID=A0A2U1MA88_ARTAN|nr:hypothetical protein CTI12_AA405510 [Artemisia annua]